MQILLVHSDAELGDPLARMVKEYTPHQCDLVPSDAAALDWARSHSKCSLLLTQLDTAGIDGLSLGSALSESFGGLQTLFFPNYSASERRLEIADTKVFPEPIDGDALLGAIERAEKMTAGGPDLFHVLDVLQMCCLGRCSGALQIVKEKHNGLVFLHKGRLLHAKTTAAHGIDALAEMVGWQKIEFAYDRSVRPPIETITVPWDEALIEVVKPRRRVKNIASSG